MLGMYTIIFLIFFGKETDDRRQVADGGDAVGSERDLHRLTCSLRPGSIGGWGCATRSTWRSSSPAPARTTRPPSRSPPSPSRHWSLSPRDDADLPDAADGLYLGAALGWFDGGELVEAAAAHGRVSDPWTNRVTAGPLLHAGRGSRRNRPSRRTHGDRWRRCSATGSGAVMRSWGRALLLRRPRSTNSCRTTRRLTVPGQTAVAGRPHRAHGQTPTSRAGEVRREGCPRTGTTYLSGDLTSLPSARRLLDPHQQQPPPPQHPELAIGELGTQRQVDQRPGIGRLRRLDDRADHAVGDVVGRREGDVGQTDGLETRRGTRRTRARRRCSPV